MKHLYLPFLLAFTLLFVSRGSAQISCTGGGNLFVYANYDGGVLNINVDVNVPNIKIGVCTYEPVTINITGAFVGNVTEVRYAGYVSTTNNHCPNSPSTTTITGVSPGITSVNFLPPSTLSNPNGNNSIVCAYSCGTTSSQGGCNTADQIKAYFESSTGGTLVSYFTQYGCWSTSQYNLSTGGNCCSSVVQCAMTAQAGSNQIICAGGTAQLSGSGTGGVTTYSWSPSAGLNNPNIANPTASPSQTTTYVLTVSDGAACAAVDSVTVTISDVQLTVPAFQGVCLNAAPVALTGATPSGGVWSGASVSGGNFVPSAVGIHYLDYTYVDTLGCTFTAQDSIEVFPLPTASFGAVADVCVNAPSFLLTNGSPGGGVYAGPGVAAGTFIPSIAGAGTHTLQYAYTDGNGCSDTVAGTLTVHPLPATPTITLSGVDSLHTSMVADSFVWYLNGVPYLTNGPSIQATQGGQYSVVAWENGCASDTSVLFMYEPSAVDLGGDIVVRAWPNPVGEELYVEGGAVFSVWVLDAAGRMVIAARAIEGKGNLEMRGLRAGVYFVEVECEGRRGVIRVIKE